MENKMNKNTFKYVAYIKKYIYISLIIRAKDNL